MSERYLTVYDKAGRPIAAKTLVDKNGNDIINPLSSMPLVVPRSFNMETAIAYGKDIAFKSLIPSSDPETPNMLDGFAAGIRLADAVRRGGDWDLQRSYNDVKNGGFDEFVSDFTPAASYMFGVLGRSIGFSDAELRAGGGIYNLLSSRTNSSIDTSGNWWNNPNNVRLINNGTQAVDQNRFSDSSSAANFKSNLCFTAGTQIRLADGTTKGIEEISVGDSVLSFDPSNLDCDNDFGSRRVKKIFRNVSKVVIDVCGVTTTPGHVFLTQDTNEIGRKFLTLKEILVKDLVLITEDGRNLRARTGTQIDSDFDIELTVLYEDEQKQTHRLIVRAGIPVRNLSSTYRQINQNIPLVVYLKRNGFEVNPDGRISALDGTIYDAVHWPIGSSPFEDGRQVYIVSRNGKCYVPEWLNTLPDSDEERDILHPRIDAHMN